MKISTVGLFQVYGVWTPPEQAPGHRQVGALDIYPEFNAQDWSLSQTTGAQEIHAAYVEIQTDAGISGLFGPIDAEQCFVIATYLRSYLIGRDPLANELLHDQMLRLHRHGRSGFFMMGISAIDCALWDLKGKAWGQPVYRLLGGPTRLSVPAYASMLGYSVEPEQAAAVALEFKRKGYVAQKWFFRYGPGDGAEGKLRNLAMIRALRQALGPFYTLMADAYWGWDRAYAREMAQALEPYNLTWLEEPLPPERVGGFGSLKGATRVPLATGEHVYTRWQVKELLASGAIEVVQSDPDWCGGITELVKICALASAFSATVLAHGHSLLAALHVAAAQSPEVVPMVEFLMRHQMNKQYFHTACYMPENGVIQLPDLPGLGIVLDEQKIKNKKEL